MSNRPDGVEIHFSGVDEVLFVDIGSVSLKHIWAPSSPYSPSDQSIDSLLTTITVAVAGGVDFSFAWSCYLYVLISPLLQWSHTTFVVSWVQLLIE